MAAIQIRQLYNPKLKWTNPQARVYVLQSDKQAVRNGRKPEPFAPILNVGDCAVYKLTNELPWRSRCTVFTACKVTERGQNPTSTWSTSTC